MSSLARTCSLLGATVLALVGLSGCEVDPSATKIMYMPDMVNSPVAKLQRSFLLPPAGSVPRNAMLYPPENDVSQWEKLLHNPYTGHPQASKYVAEGKKLFLYNCVPCHGTDAKGQGTLVDKFPPSPDITSAMYAEKADGFFFHKITVGGAIMPPRREHTSPHERWKIVLYLRSLQQKNESTK